MVGNHVGRLELLVALGLFLGLGSRVNVTLGALGLAALARELGVVGGLGWHLGEQSGRGRRLKLVDVSGCRSRVQRLR